MNDITKSVNLKQVKITDNFWEKEIALVRDAVIPYQWKALNDQIPDAQPSYCMHNFKVAGNIVKNMARKADYVRPVYTTNGFCVWPEDAANPDERFYGFLFQDSDFFKWVEAVAYSLLQRPDPELERTADEAIDIVCRAQQMDGYLDTFYIINDISKRFTNLKDNHELYCFGHLTEGAIAYFEATGKDKLLTAACRYADCIATHIGSGEGQLHGYPGHEIAEMALARLYEVTGEEKYLKLGLYFINERGRQPYFFDQEASAKDTGKEGLRYQYYQAHLPVREQTQATGHAVRAVYLYSGMADYARLTGDESLKTACERLWDDIVQRKMYITGGIGATHLGEAFSFAYDLPNDTAYAETCASIGMVFFARRMLTLCPDSKYADIMERELYNTILSGMGLEGTSFFYVNPLEALPEACHKDERKQHVKPIRQKWFGCACCPPNLARLISSIGAYVFTETENSLFIHLYIGCSFEKTLKSGKIAVTITSEFPWQGKVRIHIDCSASEPFTIALRIPGWCDKYKAEGAQGAVSELKQGYLYLTKAWKSDTLELTFPMEVQVLDADERVREDIGKAALMRGPIVYCLEEADNGKELHLLKMDTNGFFETVPMQIGPESVLAVKTAGLRQKKVESQSLYRPHQNAEYEKTTLVWIPYYAWSNRGEGEMQVFTRI